LKGLKASPSAYIKVYKYNHFKEMIRLTKLEMVLDYSDKAYKAELFGEEFGNVPLITNEVSEVIKELKGQYGKAKDDDDKARAIADKIRKAKYLYDELVKQEEKLFLKGDAEVFKVERLIEQNPNNRALLYKMDVRVGESPFSMRVSVINPHGKNKDTGENYDYFKIVLPFERSWKVEYDDNGETKERTVYDYNDMQLNRTGDEWYRDINRTWENVKGALLSGFFKISGIYDREYKKIYQAKRKKMKTKKYSQSCENCRWHHSEEIPAETESGVTTSFWRHKCYLTGDTVDDTAHKFLDQDGKEDKGPLQSGKDIIVNKNSFEEADYRPHTQRKKYLKRNALYDFGEDCPYHLFFTNFGGTIDGFYDEKTTKGIMPSLQEITEDDEAPVEFLLPDNIIVDFDDVEYVEWKQFKELDESDKCPEIPEGMKALKKVIGDDERKLRNAASEYAKRKEFTASESENFVKAYLAL
jgi:hypothetical protein